MKEIRLYGGPADGKKINISDGVYEQGLPVKVHVDDGTLHGKEYLYEARAWRREADGEIEWRWRYGPPLPEADDPFYRASIHLRDR